MEELLKEALAKNKTMKVRLRGRSMSPFFKDGEVLILSRLENSHISPGDIVVYFENNNFVCHRVFKINKNYYAMKPDAGIRPDALITFDKLIGKIVAIERKGKVYRLDNFLSRIFNKFISRFSIISAVMYPFVRRLKNIQKSLHVFA